MKPLRPKLVPFLAGCGLWFLLLTMGAVFLGVLCRLIQLAAAGVSWLFQFGYNLIPALVPQ